MNQLFQDRLKEHICIFEKMDRNEELLGEIEKVANVMKQSIKNGGAVYLCGNGGSAADAQHIATEFVSRFYRERAAINAEALTTNTSSLTAIANDYSFERVFARQIEAKGKAGDVLIGISTSGTSRNVEKALESAKSLKMHTVLLTGNKDNQYDNGIIDNVIRIPSEDTPRIQEGHIFVGHVLAEYVENECL